MKFRAHFYLIAFFLLPALAGCIAVGNPVRGSGDITTRTYDVRDFNRVTLEGIGDVYITQGNTESLSVETDENIFQYLVIRVRGNDLILGTKPIVNLIPSVSIIFRLTVKDLNGITLAGSGSIYSDPLQTSGMQVTVAGSGKIEVKGLSGTDLSVNLPGSGSITIKQIAVPTIDTSVNGSGNITLDGQADKQTINVNGSGKYSADDLETTSARITIAGSGHVTLWVKDQLDISVNGSGDVAYYGRPAINQSGNGSGKVSSLGEK